MSKGPEICLYCDGEGNGPGVACGFCDHGCPLDTQEDWDQSWGRILRQSVFDILTTNAMERGLDAGLSDGSSSPVDKTAEGPTTQENNG